MTKGYDYHYPVFSVLELKDMIERAEKEGREHVEFEVVHEHEYSEILDMFRDLSVKNQVEIIDNFTDEYGIDCKELEDFRSAAFECYWEDLKDSDKEEFLYEQVDKVLKTGSQEFAEEWIEENFRVDSPYDQEQMKDFIRTIGWGHLLKGE